MTRPLRLDSDRFLPADSAARSLARRLFATVERAPILCPHGHADPAWFALDQPFEDAVSLLLWPDHYILRLLFSQGVSLECLGLQPSDDAPFETDRRVIWRRFATHYRLFRGTPSRLWLDHVFAEIFGIKVRLEPETADHYFDLINAALAQAEFRPRALFEHFSIEVLATTEGALDPLQHHAAIRASGWRGRVIPTFRPDDVSILTCGFRRQHRAARRVDRRGRQPLGRLSRRARRAARLLPAHGATATDHGHPTARTADLSIPEAEALSSASCAAAPNRGAARLFQRPDAHRDGADVREDGMVMQFTRAACATTITRSTPVRPRQGGGHSLRHTDFVGNLKPLLIGSALDRLHPDPVHPGRNRLFARTGAAGRPLPLLGLVPPWWFHDSPGGHDALPPPDRRDRGILQHRGFNDDTRAFLSIPARHDVARRIDCAYLAELVATTGWRRTRPLSSRSTSPATSLGRRTGYETEAQRSNA